MKRIHVLTIVVAAAFAGCGSNPMTPEEYRDAIRKHSLGKVESFEVKRPLSEVARTFQKKAPECLNFKLTSTQTPTIGFGSLTRVYAVGKPTVLVSGNKAELHFQINHAQSVVPEPPDGAYIVIADARAVGRDRARVEIYYANGAVVAEAIRAWANGDERGCPDPMRAHER